MLLTHKIILILYARYRSHLETQFSPVVNPSAKIYPEPEETRNPNKRQKRKFEYERMQQRTLYLLNWAHAVFQIVS